MCHQLLQLYACGHAKIVCTTACPHATATGEQPPPNPLLSRSSSVVSSVGPSSTSSSARRRPDINDLPSQRPSPIRSRFEATSASASSSAPAPAPAPAPVPAPRLIASGQPPLSPGAVYQEASSPTCPTFLHDSSAASSTATSPLSSPSPSASTFTAIPEPRPLQPKYCEYYFPRYLPQSLRPCVACFVQPKWEKERHGWMEMCAVGHPGTEGEELEKWSGVKAIRERYGG